MSNKAIKSLSCTLLVPLSCLLGCQDADVALLPDGEANERISVTSIEVTSADGLALLHPVHVAVEAELRGEAYEADLVIALRTSDGSEGCVLGSMPVRHAGGTGVHADEAQFVIDRTCYELVDREDVELFAAFDVWNRLGDRELEAFESEIEQANTPAGLGVYALVAASAISVEGCASCETSYTLLPSPGLDAQLHALSSASSVVVLPVAGEDGVAPVEHAQRPQLSVSSSARVVGLGRGEGLDDGQLRVRHTIRPLGSSEVGLPLIERNGGHEGESAEIAVPSYGDLSKISPLFIEGSTRDAILDGSWSSVDEFEIVTCLETEFEQAIYPDEDGPRADDCGALPLVIVREPVGADGLPVPHPGAATSTTADVWSDSWTAPSSYGFGDSGVSFLAWLDVNSSDSAATTYGGIEVNSAGSWFEAGFYSSGTVFDTNVELADFYATFIGYEFGGGGVAMGATLFALEIVPEFEIQMSNGVPLTLQDIFDAAGIDVELEITKSVSIYGVSFDDGCGTVNAGLWVEGSLGIDTEETSVMARTTTQGVEVSGTITPYASITAKAGTEVEYSGYLSGGIVAELNVITIDVPFTVAVEAIDFSPLSALRLVFSESANAVFESLEGSIWFSIVYEFGIECPGIPYVTCWEDDHTHTIASWSGYEWGNLSLFDLTQKINFGSESVGSGWCIETYQSLYTAQVDGDGELDYVCHRSTDGYVWVDYASDGYEGTDLVRTNNWCSGNVQMVVGDFDGNGYDDLYCHKASTKKIAYGYGGGEYGTVGWTGSNTWCDASLADDATIRVGDYNDDGRDDLYCYTYDSQNHALNYADSGGVFGSTSDWSNTYLPEVLPSFMEAGSVSLDENWVTVNLSQSFTNPVVIAGPSTYVGSDPVVVRVRNVTSSSFQIRLQEWDYDDGGHGYEDVSWMVIEAGVNVADDGSIWEAGFTTAGGTAEQKTTKTFSGSYSSVPHLLATGQTYNDAMPVSVRVDNLSSSSFAVLLDEEEAITNGHATETIGYLAISGTPTDTGSYDVLVESVRVGEDWVSINGGQLMMQEETSLDSEVEHTDDLVSVLDLSSLDGTKLTFAQDTSYDGKDSASLRRR